MLSFATVLEFSHTYCVAICAALVPLNLVATLGTMGLVGTQRPVRHIRVAVAVALLLALVMVLHVLTWFVIGVVQVPTYVLLGLGSLCLVMNLWAIAHRGSMQQVLQAIARRVRLWIGQSRLGWHQTHSLPARGEAK
jgi:hypothetical protein